MSNQDLSVPDTRLMETKGSHLLNKISEIRIKDVESYQLVGDLLLETKRIVNTIEQEFESSIKKAHEAHKTILDLRRKVIDQFVEAETLAKSKMANYVKQIDEAHKIDGISYITEWTGEVTMPGLIPREYLMPDEKKLKTVTRSLKGETNIPGWRVWMEKQVRVEPK